MSGRNNGWVRALLVAAVAILEQVLKQRGKQSGQQQRGTSGQRGQATFKKQPQQPASSSNRQRSQSEASSYEESPGQYGDGATRDLNRAEIRALRPSYEPRLDGEPDPGEVVWTWVPFVENDGRGKDRPVLIIARLGNDAWAGCYLTTKEHRGFVSVGTGPWDSQGRESFLSPERVLRITEAGMRRESTGMSQGVFERAVSAVLRYHGA